MKHYSIILVLFLMALMVMPLFVQADVTNSTPISLISTGGTIISEIQETGLKWFANIYNILFIAGFLVGLGFVITKTTTTKKDDKWYGKYILKPWRFIGNVLTFFKIDPDNPRKKKIK
jgi:hypothetical protein